MVDGETFIADTFGGKLFQQPALYLRLRASLKSFLPRESPYFSNGRVVSQLEEPLSMASSTAFDG
jgi:hypothetical protein